MCPLLVAVLPLRYAIAPYNGIDGTRYNLPTVEGYFPWLGSEHAGLEKHPVGYALRPLRDGWLYCWVELEQRLVEYEVISGRFKETTRGGAVIDDSQQAYLSLPAGSNIGLRWSPVKLSDVRFSELKASETVRARFMRIEVAGKGESSGPVIEAEQKLADINLEPLTRFNWSCAPTGAISDWQGLVNDMQQCEVQAYMAVDDPWGITLDLTAMIQQCRAAYEALHADRQPSWNVAEVLRGFYEQDPNLKNSIPKLTRFNDLQQTWQEHDQSQSDYEVEINRLLAVWVAWFATLQLEGLETLNTACQLFDLEQDLDRDVLEFHFSLACLDPSSTAKGAMAIRYELLLSNDQNWLWKVIAGIKTNSFLNSEFKNILTVADATAAQSDDLKQLGHTAVLLGLNQAAEQLNKIGVVVARGALFNAIAPALASLTDERMRLFMTSLMARAQLTVSFVQVPVRQLREWMSELIGTGEDARRLGQRPLGQGTVSVADIHPVGQPAAERGVNILRKTLDLAKEMPFKTAILLVSGWNVLQTTSSVLDDESTSKDPFRFLGSVTGLTAISSAILQELAEAKWKNVALEYGEESKKSLNKLASFARLGSMTSLLLSATAALDVVVFGMVAYEAWDNADYDTAVVNVGLAGVSVGQVVIAGKMYRAFRAARAAALAGELASATRALGFIGGLYGRIGLGLLVTALAGLYIRSQTQNTKIENWVAHTRFGLKPAAWSSDYQQELIKLYEIVFVPQFHLEQPLYLNPRNGEHYREIYLIFTMDNQRELTEELLRFKGDEIWSGRGIRGIWSDQRQPVTWTGADFHLDSGTRRPRQSISSGQTRYRRVYHPSSTLGEFKGLKGEIIFSPLPGLVLPALKLEF